MEKIQTFSVPSTCLSDMLLYIEYLSVLDFGEIGGQ